MPTDTVYGLAAAVDVPDGVEALYRLKGRPRRQPCQVLIYTRALLEELLEGLDAAPRRAAEALLPGPVTCIVPDPAGRFSAAAGDQPGGVGLRAPRAPDVVAGLDLPLIATSANDPGGPDPRTLDAVPPRIRAGVTRELDAGPLPGTASAVVDLRPLAGDGHATLLRPGPEPARVAAVLAAAGLRLAGGPGH